MKPLINIIIILLITLVLILVIVNSLKSYKNIGIKLNVSITNGISIKIQANEKSTTKQNK